MAHRGTSLPLAGGSHQLGVLIDPIHPPLDSGAASLNSRSGADGSGGIAGATRVCALAIAGIAKNATRTSVGRPGTLVLTLRAGCWSLAEMTCPASSKFRRYSRMIAVTIAGMLRGSATLLNLWKKQLGRVPDSVWDQAHVEVLILADNGLEDVSEKIGRLQKLRTLDLGHNRLTRVPDALGELADLEDFLYLHANRLASLPASFTRLTRLRYLNISQNEFAELPEAVTELASLIELRATDNQLNVLPESIGRLSRLRELHLRNNRLTSLPASLAMLQELRQIDLRGNPLTRLPDAITALPRLEKLDLRWVTTLAPRQWIAGLEARGCVVYR